MLVQEYIEILQSIKEGTVFTDENRLSEGFMTNVLNVGRQQAIKELHKEHGLVHPAFYQEVTVYAKDLHQESDCETLFKVPRFVAVNRQRITGVGYVGASKGTDAWRYVKTRGQWANQLAKRVGNSRKNFIIDFSKGYMTVDSKINQALISGIAANPLEDIWNFNREFDDYPITDEAFQLVEQYVRTGMMRQLLKVPDNTRPNSTSDITAQQPTAQ